MEAFIRKAEVVQKKKEQERVTYLTLTKGRNDN